MAYWGGFDAVTPQPAPGQPKVPLLVWVVALATLISNLTGDSILGYQVSGFGWFVPLVFALYVLFTTPGKPSFPFWIWIPWFGLIIGYFAVADAESALQRSVMFLTPMVIGIAVSKAMIGETELLRIDSLSDKVSVVFFIAILVNTGLIWTGVLPEVTGLAPQATTAALFGTFFAAKYALGNRGAAFKWLLFAAVPVIAVTRTAMVATGLTLPLTFAPLPLLKRLSILVGVAVIGYMVFNTQRVQEKMFYSGEGTVFDLSIDNPDLRTTGRTFILDAMKQKVKESPWFGHGANASEQFVSDLTGVLTHPHDDYLRLTFDYGYVGLSLFLACMIGQILHALRAGYRSAGAARLFLLVGSAAFIPFAMLMATDNVILYGAFFGNLQFTILGAGYAAIANQDRIQAPARYLYR